MPEKEKRNGVPTGRWRAKWRDAAGRQATKTFAKRGEAKAHEDHQREAIRTGTYIDRHSARTPLAVVGNDWLAIHSQRIRAESVKSYETALRRIIGRWGQAPIADLDGYTLTAWLDGLARDFSAPYVETHRNVLAMIFDYAKSRGMVAVHPLTERRRRGTARPRREALVPTAEQVYLAWSQPDLPDHLGLAWRLMAECGLRPGEALGLRWPDDVDFRGRVVHVRRQLDRAGNIDAPTKTPHSVRPVPVTDELLDAINLHVTGGHGPSQAGTLLRDAYGRACRDHVLQTHSKRAWTAAGLPFTNNALRRYYATGLTTAGLSPLIVDAVMGHSPGTVLGQHYFKLTDEHHEQVRAALPSLAFLPGAPQVRRTEGSTGL